MRLQCRVSGTANRFQFLVYESVAIDICLILNKSRRGVPNSITLIWRLSIRRRQDSSHGVGNSRPSRNPRRIRHILRCTLELLGGIRSEIPLLYVSWLI